jgi:MPBQ/MSBQ methyltransferase
MTRDSVTFFDAMAAGYETLEPWYEHLYAGLHAVLRAELVAPAKGRALRALDAGCGTGFQTAILDEMGYAAHGLDLSRELLRAARGRLGRGPLVQGDVQTLPYRDGTFTAVTCCGSALSYVDDARRALAEIARVLRPDGRLLVECEGRWSLDLGWAWLSGLLGDPWGYGLGPGEVWRAATTPRDRECRLQYPGYGSLRLFTAAELQRLLRAEGLEPVRTWGIHSITNVLPSTVLHRPRLGRRMAAVYRILRGADRALAARWPATRLGNSLVVLAHKARAGARP